MKMIDMPKEKKVCNMANHLSKIRGYDGFCHIDDPELREWIWEKAAKEMHCKKFLVVSIIGFLTPVVVAFVIGVLLGMWI